MEFKQWTGGKIDADGAYDGISLREYHGDLCVGPSLSKTGIKTILSQSPAHYYAQSYLNPERDPASVAHHFSIGQAAHFLFLRETTNAAQFAEYFAVRPHKFRDWRTNEAKAWRAERELEGKIVLKDEDFETMERMAESLSKHPLAKDLLQGAVEKTLVWRDPKTGVWLKSRPDAIPVADGIAADLKCEASSNIEDFQRSIGKHGYAYQAALTRIGLKKLFDIEMTDFVFVVVEKSPPYAVAIIVIDSDWIYWALRDVRKAIDIFADCVATDRWPAFPREMTAYMPVWMKRYYEQEADAGLLPEPKETDW